MIKGFYSVLACFPYFVSLTSRCFTSVVSCLHLRCSSRLYGVLSHTSVIWIHWQLSWKWIFWVEFSDNFWWVAEIQTSFLNNAGMEIPFLMKGRPSEVLSASVFTSMLEGRAQALDSLIVVWGSFLSCTNWVTAINLPRWASGLIWEVFCFCDGQHRTT